MAAAAEAAFSWHLLLMGFARQEGMKEGRTEGCLDGAGSEEEKENAAFVVTCCTS